MHRRQFLEGTLAIGALQFFGARAAWGKADDTAMRAMKRINTICNDLKLKKIDQSTWQVLQEEALSKIDLKDMLKYVDIDKVMTQKPMLDRSGMKIFSLDLTAAIGGATMVPMTNLFATSAGGGELPHGHNGVCASHLVVRGKMQVVHWERLRDTPKELFISQSPTIDVVAETGDYATLTDIRGNVHRLKALGGPVVYLNVHNANSYDPRQKKPSVDFTNKAPYWKRIYCDVDNGRIMSDGTRCARVLSYEEAVKLYQTV